jgi:hypothetical protein
MRSETLRVSDTRIARDAMRPSDHASGPMAREQTGSGATRECPVRPRQRDALEVVA